VSLGTVSDALRFALGALPSRSVDLSRANDTERLLLRSMLCGSDDCGQEVCAYRRLALVVHLDGLVAIVADMILVRARSVPRMHFNLVHKPYS
jgi:hypothetical protein